MKENKWFFVKCLFTVIFAAAIFGAYGYVIHKGDFSPAYLSYGCVCACFLFALLFLKWTKRSVLFTLALATNVVADYFLILMPSEENKLIGLYFFCGVQFFYFIYTLMLAKGNGTRVVNIALRVALCLIAYFVLKQYYTLSILEIVAIVYIINFFVNLLVLLLHLKTEWLPFLGLLLFFTCDVFVGLTNGGVELFQITGAFVEFIYKYDIAFYTYIPGLFLIASSAVWQKNKL